MIDEVEVARLERETLRHSPALGKNRFHTQSSQAGSVWCVLTGKTLEGRIVSHYRVQALYPIEESCDESTEAIGGTGARDRDNDYRIL
jgi:hypothetical protein